MPDQVPDDVKRERIERLVEVVQRIAAERNEERVGRVEEVLVEGPSRTDAALLRGRTRRNTTVNFAGAARPGELVDVRIEGATSTTLRGTPVVAASPRDRARPRLGRLLERPRPRRAPDEAGGETRSARSSAPTAIAQLTDAGWQALVAYGVRTDRRPAPARRARRRPARAARGRGRARVRAARARVGGLGEIDEAARARPDAATATEVVYVEFLERFRDRFARAVRDVADAPEGGVVVHCDGGKDRTGLVAALLLRLAGVPPRRSATTTRCRGRTCAPCTTMDRRRDAEERARGHGSQRRPPRRWSACSRRSSTATATSRATSATRARRRDDRARPQPPAPVTLLALFGPTASGKSAVARAIAGLVAAADLGRLGAGLPRAADPDEPGRPAAAAGRDLAARPRGLGRGVPAARARGDRRGARRRPRPVIVGGTGLYLRAALTAARAPAGAGAGRTRALGGALRADGAGAGARGARRARPGRGRARPPNDRRRVVRALELAEAGSSLAGDRLVGGGGRVPTSCSGSRCPARSSRAGSRRGRGEMVERGVEEEVRRALAGPLSATARKILGLSEAAELPREQAIERMDAARASSPPISESGCGACPGSLASMPTGRPRRPPLRSSTWHAHGNVYRVVERPEADAYGGAGALGRDGRGRADGRGRRGLGRGRDLEPGRLDRGDVRERHAHRRRLAGRKDEGGGEVASEKKKKKKTRHRAAARGRSAARLAPRPGAPARAASQAAAMRVPFPDISAVEPSGFQITTSTQPSPDATACTTPSVPSESARASVGRQLRTLDDSVDVPVRVPGRRSQRRSPRAAGRQGR